MYLEVSKSGGKYWRLKYLIANKEKRLALGIYPALTLKSARLKRDEAKILITAGKDPGHLKKIDKQVRQRPVGDTFKDIALDWHTTKKSGWSDSHAHRTLRQMERDLFPWIGDRPMKDITGNEILHALRKVEERGAVETADRGLIDQFTQTHKAILMMNAPFDKLETPEQILAGHINYGGQGITIVCGASCNCKNPPGEKSKLKLSLWVRLQSRLNNPFSRTLASRLQD